MSKTMHAPLTTRYPRRSARLDGVLRAEAREIIRNTATRNPRTTY